MSADTSFFFPFFQQEKNNENENEKEENRTTFLVTSFPGSLSYPDRKRYIDQKTWEQYFYKRNIGACRKLAWWLSYLFDHA